MKNIYQNISNLNRQEIISIVSGLKNKNVEELNQIEKQIITIFYAYQIIIIQLMYIITLYHKFLPIIKTYIWFEQKYKNIKNFFVDYFYY